MARKRLRDLGLPVGSLPTGRFNAITDIAGVTVGYHTLIRDTPHVVRTGVTAIWPRGSQTGQTTYLPALSHLTATAR
jgi:D-aminopeptidase